MTPLSIILRQATRGKDEPLNILCIPTHERYETSLAATGHNFYALQAKGLKTWNTDYAPLPAHYHIMPPSNGTLNLPSWITPDVVLSQSKACQYTPLAKIAHQLSLPLISLEHTLPGAASLQYKQVTQQMLGDINVFVSEYQKEEWGIDGTVIHTGIDTEVFCPDDSVQREQVVLSVVNDWVNRDKECGFSLWCSIVELQSDMSTSIPVKVFGNTPGLSKAAKDIPSLVHAYRTASVYLNTTIVSSLPTVILEAMACGLPVVSTGTCLIPKIIIEHGVNGFIGNSPQELRSYVELVLNDKTLAKKIGEAGRKTIEEKFTKNIFVSKWQEIFNQVRQIRK
jgi:hypothetical protein